MMRICMALAAMLFFARPAHADEDAIRKTIEATIRDAEVISVKKLPYAGLYEVAVQRAEGPRVYYTDALAQLILAGAN